MSLNKSQSTKVVPSILCGNEMTQLDANGFRR